MGGNTKSVLDTVKKKKKNPIWSAPPLKYIILLIVTSPESWSQSLMLEDYFLIHRLKYVST